MPLLVGARSLCKWFTGSYARRRRGGGGAWGGRNLKIDHLSWFHRTCEVDRAATETGEGKNYGPCSKRLLVRAPNGSKRRPQEWGPVLLSKLEMSTRRARIPKLCSATISDIHCRRYPVTKPESPKHPNHFN